MNWLYFIMITVILVAHFVRMVKNNDGNKWYSIITSFGLGFCCGRFLMIAILNVKI